MRLLAAATATLAMAIAAAQAAPPDAAAPPWRTSGQSASAGASSGLLQSEPGRWEAGLGPAPSQGPPNRGAAAALADPLGDPWPANSPDPSLLPSCAPVAPAPGRCGPWTFGGWIELGTTANSHHPANPPNGFGNLPVTFNYRSDQLQWSQAYAFLERAVDGDEGWDFGGRIDLLFGEDYIFAQAAGWETRPGGTNHWNTAFGGSGIEGTGRIGLAMPQAYGEAACGNWTLQLGRFYTIVGYESVMAVDNFFYSHAYAKQYGEPFTHTGGLIRWDASDQLLLAFGLVNGWDKLDGLSDRVSFLFGAGWTSCDRRAALSLALITGDESRPGEPLLGNRTMLSLVGTFQLTDRFQYVFQHDYGRQNHPDGLGPHADWYGVNQCLLATVNDRWKAGLRAEWFNDQNGYRVADGFHPRGRGANWYELALGLNYSPSACLLFRPEVRWDFVRRHGGPAAGGPFDAGRPPGRTQQVTAATDLVLIY